jgi:general secretion pathway protein D
VVITDYETDASAPDGPADSTILPVVELQDATLADSLDFIRLKSREFNPDHRETSITVKPGAPDLPISLSLKQVSIHNTLRYIAELSGLKLSFDDGGYVLSPP